MAFLPALDRWKDQASVRLNFLQQCAAREDSSTLSQAHALTQEAELAFATGHFQRGWDCLQKAFIKYAMLPEKERLPTPTALLGSVLGQAKVTVATEHLTIACSEWKQDFAWTAPTNLLGTGIGALMGAAVASNGDIRSALPALFSSIPNAMVEPIAPSADAEERTAVARRQHATWLQRRLLFLATNAPEAGILLAYGIGRNPSFGFGPENNLAFEDVRIPQFRPAWPNLTAREEKYAAQIRLTAQHWFSEAHPWFTLIGTALLGAGDNPIASTTGGARSVNKFHSRSSRRSTG